MAVRVCIVTEPQQGADYERLLLVAQAAMTCGFDGFFSSDHLLRVGEGDQRPGPTDAWTTLAGLARETAGIRLGTLVTPVTFRLPGVLAVTVAQVDAMSGGRVELGLGAGWFQAEHRAYGVPFPPERERFDLLEEQLEIITGLWTTPQGERFSFNGRHYLLAESPALPKPVQFPHPPIILGGFGTRRTPWLAARFGGEFNVPYGTLTETRSQFARTRTACEAVGRDPASLILSAAQTVCCGRDEDELLRRAAAIGRSLEDLRHSAVTGTPDEVAAQLRAFADVGAERAYLQVLDLDDLDHLALISAEVLPRLTPARRTADSG